MATEFSPLPPIERDPQLIQDEVAQVWPRFDHQIEGHLGGGGNGWAVKVRMNQGKAAVLKYYADSLVGGSKSDLTLEQRKILMKREACIMAQFDKHPAAVTVYDLARDEPAFLMEHVSGGSLKDALGKQNLEVREKVRSFLPILNLLAILQEEQLHLRDIALDNILIDSEGCLKLIDYGFVHHPDEPVVEGWAVKRGAYIHPFQDDLKQYDKPRHDIQDVYAAVITLLGWIHDHDPCYGTPVKGWQTGDSVLDKAFEPFLNPDPILPPDRQGIASFRELEVKLEDALRLNPESPRIEASNTRSVLFIRNCAIIASLLLVIWLGYLYLPGITGKNETDDPIEQTAHIFLDEDPQPPQATGFQLSREESGVNEREPTEDPTVGQDPLPARPVKTRTHRNAKNDGIHDADLPELKIQPKPQKQEMGNPNLGLAIDLTGAIYIPLKSGSGVVENIGPLPSNRYKEEGVIGDNLALAVGEVTWSQWETVMGPWQGSGRPDDPVTGISWQAANRYANRLSAEEVGTRYRLPTEFEWMRAYESGLFPTMKNTLMEWCADDYESTGRKVFRGVLKAGDSTMNFRGNTRPDAGGINLGFRLIREAQAGELPQKKTIGRDETN